MIRNKDECGISCCLLMCASLPSLFLCSLSLTRSRVLCLYVSSHPRNIHRQQPVNEHTQTLDLTVFRVISLEVKLRFLKKGEPSASMSWDVFYYLIYYSTIFPPKFN